MKKSLMSVSVLVVSISVMLMFVCGSVANAQTKGNKFMYDKKENVETVFTLDKSGKFLTPTLRYEMKKDENGKLLEKKALRWNAEKEAWLPYYILTFTEEDANSIIEYAIWSNESQSFSVNQQKSVYNKNTEEDMVAYISYHWNPSANDWDLKEQLLFQNYMAIRVAH